MHAGSGRAIVAPSNPFARPAFEVVYENVGIVSAEGDPSDYERWRESDNLGGSSSAWDLGNPLLDATIAAWRNGRRAVTHNTQAEGDPGTIILSAVTERTWLFALRIPPDAGSFAGVGPTSTANVSGKNFPLYFKASTVIGSQPSASNRDSALDMSPYYGLDAVISVRQSAAGIRFSMRIQGVSGRVITTASGEAADASQNGWSAGGWYGGGGDYPYPIALMGVISGALSDADQDEAVDWAAWEYDLITP